LSIKAVIFDVDDTLFDYRYCCRKGLTAVQNKFKCFQKLSLHEFEKEQRKLSDEIHGSQMLAGNISLERERIERFKISFSKAGEAADESTAKEAVNIYRENYEASFRAVTGAYELLDALKSRVKIAVLSNSYYDLLMSKLVHCSLDKFVDVVVVSEQAGVTKPDTKIFIETLKKLDCKPDKAVMIGDSWEVDILGAHKAGIRSVWYNQYNQSIPDPSIAPVINSYFPVQKVLNIIFNESEGRVEN
jgi:putative hydrolase of the HAD superfamily